MADIASSAEADHLIARVYEALSEDDSWDGLFGSCAQLAGGDVLRYLRTPAMKKDARKCY